MANHYCLTGTVTLCLSLLFLIVSLYSVEWLVTFKWRAGLFEKCYMEFCFLYKNEQPSILDGSITAVIAMLILGTVICGLAALVSLAFLFFKHFRMKEYEVLPTLCLLFSCASAFFLLIGVITINKTLQHFGDSSVGFSFILCSGTIALTLIGGTLVKFGARSFPVNSNQNSSP